MNASPQALPFVLMRGGTSKGVFLRAEDAPTGRAALAALLLDLFGSPDRRQIDGLGGADKLTSKAAVIGPATRADADIDYLFAQVGMQAAEVDYRLNCGNLTAAAAVYAIQRGFVPVQDVRDRRSGQAGQEGQAGHQGITRVRVHNVNTGRVIVADVPVRDGQPLADGTLHIDGVPGCGAPIALDFAAAFGSVSGRLLALGSAVTALAVPGLGTVEVSVLDGANLTVFVAAAAVGMLGTETPWQIDSDAALVGRLNAIRQAVAQRLGLDDEWASRAVPSAPFCVVVAPPADYLCHGDAAPVRADDIDLLARQFSTGATSKAMAATVASCTGLAARVPGSVVHRALAARGHERLALAIGHPSGVINVEAALRGRPADADAEANSAEPATARIYRTARLLAEGRAFLKHHHPGLRG